MIYEVKDGVGTITLNRPRVLNALDGDLSASLADAAERAARDPEVWVVVVRGAGRAFCSGMDRTALSAGGIGEAFYRHWTAASTASRTWTSWWSACSTATASAEGCSSRSRATCGSPPTTPSWGSAPRATG